MKKIKRLNLLQTIGIIVMIISFSLSFLNIKGMIELFFIGLSINALGLTLSTIKWSKEGKTGFKKMDKDYNKNLTRKSSDTMLMMNVAYYLTLCFAVISQYVETHFKSISSLITILIVSLVANYALLYIIDSTYNQVVEIIESKNKK